MAQRACAVNFTQECHHTECAEIVKLSHLGISRAAGREHDEERHG